ncbi:anti-sigma factor antagonist [Bacillus badius]|uniref:Anti-sigma factor antagonist n=1 Tax=Bacillus badius TaxID=1455 RepID=A0ABR5ATI8_BACBA|nr:anti-sigma factor antagonist [Bacillus badius]KIL72929.1 anti-sigma F factor antagonist (spoIIAA-2) [Bacillus badius]KIL78055.1 anti-sigma F factor antagonist (spoIIAA-2) [Bacillus badius]KZO00421.1 anti-anti sigma factor [Bacillus badius]KZR57136.1 anti-anti sigma factor [Bacillus badius]MED0666247.1 anti-sigma factor antagonist [Bacillus badius]
MNITIDVKEMEQQTKVKIAGEIDAYTAPKLRETVFPYTEKDQARIVIDLSEVSYMDSTGLGVFVGLFKSLNANGGTLQLIGLSERLRRLFDITGLADIMNINSEVEGGV